MTETTTPAVPARPTGNDVRRWRERLGETQAEFARRFAVSSKRAPLSRHSVSKIEAALELAPGMSARVRDVMEAAARELSVFASAQEALAPAETATTEGENHGEP